MLILSEHAPAHWGALRLPRYRAPDAKGWAEPSTRLAGGGDERRWKSRFAAMHKTKLPPLFGREEEKLPDLCSLLGVAVQLLEFPLSFSAAIRRMGGFGLVVLAHSTQRLFYGGCSRSAGLQMKQLCEFEQFVFAGHACFPPSF